MTLSLKRSFVAAGLMAGLLVSTAPRSDGQSGQTDAQSDDVATNLLDKVYANFGTPEKLASIRTRVMEGTASFGGGQEGTFTETLGGPGHARVETKLPGFGEFAEGSGFGTVWEINPMTGKGSSKKGTKALTALRHYALLRHTPWREIYANAKVLGKATIDGRETIKLELTPLPPATCAELNSIDPAVFDRVAISANASEGADASDVFPDIWYVDEKAALLVRTEVQVVGPSGDPMTVEITYRDHRRVDGVLYEHERSASMIGMVWKQKYTKIRHNVDLPEDAFDVPAAVLEAIDVSLSPADGSRAGIAFAEIEPQHAAVIRTTCKADAVGAQLAICLPEVMMHLTSIGANVTSAPFTRMLSIGDDEVEIEAGMSISAPIEASGRIVPIELPGGTVVSAWHTGPYHDLPKTHAAARAWLAEQGAIATGPMWEVYWTDPGLEPDSSKWKTQVILPCERTAER